MDSHSDAAIMKERFSNVKEGWNQLQLNHEMFKNLLADEREREAIRNQEEEWICRVEEEFKNAKRVHVEYIRKVVTQPTTASFDQSLKEKQSALLKRKIEFSPVKKHIRNMLQPWQN